MAQSSREEEHFAFFVESTSSIDPPTESTSILNRAIRTQPSSVTKATRVVSKSLQSVK